MKVVARFIALLMLLLHGLAAAQVNPGMPRIGVLVPGNLTDPDTKRGLEVFLRALRDGGYVLGENIAVEYRAAGGKANLLPNLAAELVRLKVSLIVAVGTTAIEAALKTTKSVPVVMISGGNPVGRGFVTSLVVPGGNVTGLSSVADGDEGKRMELLKDTFPWISRILILNADRRTTRLDNYIRESKGLDVALEALDITESEDLPKIFAALSSTRAEGLITVRSIFTIRHAGRIADFALRHRLPSIYESREFVEKGGLMAYGVDYTASWRRAPFYVDKILKGANPALLPVEPPGFKFSINLRTASRMNFKIPAAILLEANEIIR